MIPFICMNSGCLNSVICHSALGKWRGTHVLSNYVLGYLFETFQICLADSPGLPRRAQYLDKFVRHGLVPQHQSAFTQLAYSPHSRLWKCCVILHLCCLICISGTFPVFRVELCDQLWNEAVSPQNHHLSCLSLIDRQRTLWELSLPLSDPMVMENILSVICHHRAETEKRTLWFHPAIPRQTCTPEEVIVTLVSVNPWNRHRPPRRTLCHFSSEGSSPHTWSIHHHLQSSPTGHQVVHQTDCSSFCFIS